MRVSLLVTLSSCAAALRAVPPTRACVSMSSTARPFTPNTPRDGGVISELAAQWALGKMSCTDVELDTPELRASVRTTFLRPEPSSASGPERPLVLFLHGADFSCLEWRLVMRPLLEAGIDCVALDWYSGGWTDRLPLNARLQRAADALPEEYQKGGGEVTPWAIVRQHLQAFWAQELEGRQLVVVSSSRSSRSSSSSSIRTSTSTSTSTGSTTSPYGTTTRLHGCRPVVLVGASLGGAVALDFATTHPGAVSKLILIDAGGESFKAPPPDTVASLAAPVLAVKSFFQGVQERLPGLLI